VRDRWKRCETYTTFCAKHPPLMHKVRHPDLRYCGHEDSVFVSSTHVEESYIAISFSGQASVHITCSTKSPKYHMALSYYFFTMQLCIEVYQAPMLYMRNPGKRNNKIVQHWLGKNIRRAVWSYSHPAYL
jgi:hypothetical protein